MTRDQAWLLPPTLEDLLPAEHPARFVAAFTDALTADIWTELGIELMSPMEGAPAYHPRSLLSVWLYGFMTGVRSCRKLEAACRDQIPYLWLTGWQHPDHNTLWRFYKAHRPRLRRLLKQTVQTAARVGLIDWAVQAVDGTKVAGNAAKARSFDAAELQRLLARTDAAIADLEAQNAGGEDPPPPSLPAELCEAQALRERLQAALQQCEEEGHAVNLTDPDARLMKARQGIIAGYNAQAMAIPVAPEAGGGMLITAAVVTQDATDQAQLLPMVKEAEAVIEGRPELTLADAGYLSGNNLAACSEEGIAVVIPDEHLHPPAAYHKDRFNYDAASDTYTCPEGQALAFTYVKHKAGEGPVRVYRAMAATCRACPAFGRCTKSADGRRIERTQHDELLQAHHVWMQRPEARRAARLRKQLIEPVFGILKEQLGARRFLLRGIENVGHEWTLLATAFNMRTLWRVWKASLTAPRLGRCLAA
ncbi:MAG: IS1182 family transposase [Chloroflexi bacterium]|nr:IS1182 family transposase [Chloroflexota bacterium]